MQQCGRLWTVQSKGEIVTIRRLIAAKQRPDTLADVAERVKRIAAGKQAHAETMAKFGAITGDNVREALAFQEQRTAELESCTCGSLTGVHDGDCERIPASVREAWEDSHD